MTLSPEQLEWIVQEVVRRLQINPPTTRANSALAGGIRRLAITGRLVTTETLRNQLEDITHLDVVASAVVTPAVVDLLRDRQITLVRATT